MLITLRLLTSKERSRAPVKALLFEKKCLCLPDTWSCCRRGMLWAALWPLLLCVCINTHHSCSDNNLKHWGHLDGNKKSHRRILVLHYMHWECINIKNWRSLQGLGLSSAESEQEC